MKIIKEATEKTKALIIEHKDHIQKSNLLTNSIFIRNLIDFQIDFWKKKQ